MNLEQFNQLKKQAAQAQREVDEGRGALKQLDVQLEEELGVTDPEQGAKLLKKMERETKEAEAAYQQELKQFEEEFREQVQGEE